MIRNDVKLQCLASADIIAVETFRARHFCRWGIGIADKFTRIITLPMFLKLVKCILVMGMQGGSDKKNLLGGGNEQLKW